MLPLGTGTETKGISDLPPEGRYGLAGREEEMTALEGALLQAPIILITGPQGIGKTELACGFARRLLSAGKPAAPAEGRETHETTSSSRKNGGSRPALARFTSFLFTSFLEGGGLYRLLHEMGTTLRGISFARLSLEEQRRWLIDYLAQNPCLLIWDDFENAFTGPDRGDRVDLTELLKDISKGPSRVLITGRGKAWIGKTGAGGALDHVDKTLRGLKGSGARQMAEIILSGAGMEPPEKGPDYLRLLRRLNGSPMAISLVLPHLKHHPPDELAQCIEGDRRSRDRAGSANGGTGKYLDAALACSFSHLSQRTRAHLPFLSMFRQRVLLDVLTFMTQGDVYTAAMGEEMGWGACRTFLREARDHGLLDSVSPSIYLIHPAVSRFLAQELARQLHPSQVRSLEGEFGRVYADVSDYFLENLSSESAESAVTGVLAEEANLLHALELAQAQGNWEQVQMVLQPLAQVYKMQERVLELRRLRGRLLARLGVEPAQAEKKGSLDLWLYLQGTEVNDAIGRQEFDRAEGICQTVLRHLDATVNTNYQAQTASIYHSLGMIAQARDLHQQAEGWYRKALDLNEEMGNEAECADSYHQLGLVAQSRRAYVEAGEWLRKSLEIRERLEDEAEAGSDCYQLGLVSEAQFKFQDAMEWHDKARMIYEHLEDKPSAAAVYHRLGVISQAHYDYEGATDWYQRALLTYEELGDEVGGADDCYQMGLMALARYEYEEAEDWLNQALGFYRRLLNDAKAAEACHQLGVAAHSQRRFQEAEDWYQKALELFLQLEDKPASASTWGQLGLLCEHRGDYPAAVWYVAHTYEIAAAHGMPLLDQAKTHLSKLRSKMGTDEFIRSWQDVSDTDVIAELE